MCSACRPASTCKSAPVPAPACSVNEGPVKSNCALMRFAGIFGMQPITPAASKGAITTFCASEFFVSMRQRVPKRATSASGSIAMNTAVLLLGADCSSNNASRAACKIASCCGSVCVKSRGGKRSPVNSSASSVIVPLPSGPRKEVLEKKASLSCARFAAVPAIAPMPTTAMASLTVLASFASALSLSSKSCSDKIKCALLPPKPNAEIAAMRTLCPAISGQGSAFSSTRNGEPRRALVKFSVCKLGGRVAARIASITLIMPAAPAAVIKCPRFDFNEAIGRFLTSLNTAALLRISVASPTEVPVAWHSSNDTAAGSKPAL